MRRPSGERVRAHSLARQRRVQFLVGVLLLILIPTPVLAQPIGLQVKWFAMNGGGTSQGANYAIQGIAGQPDASAATGGRYKVASGFQLTRAEVPQQTERAIYLPLVSASP